MEKEILEVVLNKLDRESRIASIIDIETVPAIPKGENFTSTILRIKLKVVLGNGRLAKKSFIAKKMVTEGEFMKQHNVLVFIRENQVYSVIHKHMTYLMEEFEDTEEPLWCKFIHYDLHLSCILLEDLKASGYTLVPRQKGLDLDHAILALRGLGKYHGMGKVLEQRGIISKDDYSKIFYTLLRYIRCVPYAGISKLAKVMQESWGQKWEERAKELSRTPFDPFAAKVQKVFQLEDGEFTVLNHGDCWSNNMMFKYDYQNRPISVKFLDFASPRNTSPCLDITYFMYQSIQPAIRRSNYHLLLKTYHESLIRTLDKFGYTGNKPTIEEITDTMDRFEFFGLILFLAMFPGVSSSSKEAFDFEKLLTTDGREGFDEEVFREHGLMEKMEPDITHYLEKYLKNL